MWKKIVTTCQFLWLPQFLRAALYGITHRVKSVLRVTANTSHKKPLKIAIFGCGPFGQFLRKLLSEAHTVVLVNRAADACVADLNTAHTFYSLESIEAGESDIAKEHIDVIIFAVSITSLEQVVARLPQDIFANTLVVDVCSVKVAIHEVLNRVG